MPLPSKQTYGNLVVDNQTNYCQDFRIKEFVDQILAKEADTGVFVPEFSDCHMLVTFYQQKTEDGGRLFVATDMNVDVPKWWYAGTQEIYVCKSHMNKRESN